MKGAFTPAYVLGMLEGAMWLPPISHWEIVAEENGDWSIHGELKADTPGEARRLLRPLADIHDTDTATEGHLLTVTFQRDGVSVRVWWLLPVRCWTDRVPVIAAAGTETWLAEYEGAEPRAFTSEDAARAYCDDFARAEAPSRTEACGRTWDWQPTEDGYLQQIWTRALDDAPTGATGGIVTHLTIQDGTTTSDTSAPADTAEQDPITLRWDRLVIHPASAEEPTIVACMTDDDRPAALFLDTEHREALGLQLVDPDAKDSQ